MIHLFRWFPRETEKEKRVATRHLFLSRDALFHHLCEQFRRWTTRSRSQIEHGALSKRESTVYFSSWPNSPIVQTSHPSRRLGMRNLYQIPRAPSVRRDVSQTFEYVSVFRLTQHWKFRSLCVLLDLINRIEREQVYNSCNLDHSTKVALIIKCYNLVIKIPVDRYNLVIILYMVIYSL